MKPTYHRINETEFLGLVSSFVYLVSVLVLIMDRWVLGIPWLQLITRCYKIGVINNPLGQTHSHASSEHCFLLFCFSRFEKWVRTYGRLYHSKYLIICPLQKHCKTQKHLKYHCYIKHQTPSKLNKNFRIQLFLQSLSMEKEQESLKNWWFIQNQKCMPPFPDMAGHFPDVYSWSDAECDEIFREHQPRIKSTGSHPAPICHVYYSARNLLLFQPKLMEKIQTKLERHI